MDSVLVANREEIAVRIIRGGAPRCSPRAPRDRVAGDARLALHPTDGAH